MENLTPENYKIGMFVRFRRRWCGVLVGKSYENHTRLLLPNGSIKIVKITSCKIMPKAPMNPNVDILPDAKVVVKAGRLKGMFGQVLGSMTDKVFVRTLNDCKEEQISFIRLAERTVFVTGKRNLCVWEIDSTPFDTFRRRTGRLKRAKAKFEKYIQTKMHESQQPQ